MIPSKWVRLALAVLFATVAASAVAGATQAVGRAATGARAATAAKDEIIVSAAVSLKDALDEISGLYQRSDPGLTVRLNLGGSGTLLRQIEQGAPVDVFISASPEEMNALASKGLLLPGARRDLVMNRLVLIVPLGKSLVESFQDLEKPGVKHIAIGEPQTVPAGKYAQQVLTHFGIYDRLKPKFVYGKDVRQVLAYVETGNVDAGIVYATDALSSHRVNTVATAPDASHSPVVYPVALLDGSKNPATAREFEMFLFGTSARAIFQKYGFVPVM